jgi:plasmid stabilization system protein ParE
MATRRLIFSRQSLNDLEDIQTYVANNASAEMGRHVITEILAAIDPLVEMPGNGHTRSDLSSQHRVWSVFRYLIVYRFDAQALHIVRVVHGHRDLRRIRLR